MKLFEKAVFVIGPTASGKTALAHAIADSLIAQGKGCELVNIDAFQFYRGVSAGTAKPSPAEIAQYKYHGIDILNPEASMDAARYAEFVWGACKEIYARGNLPVCVGGSGLYLRAALHGLDPLPPRNDELRQMFRASAEAWGWPELHRWLELLAPERATQLHPNDKTRIERALEIVFQLPEGVTPKDVFTKLKPLSQQSSVGDVFLIQVDCADAILKQRISQRIAGMFSSGWFEEIIGLRNNIGDVFAQSQAFKAIGYPEIWEWIVANDCSTVSNETELSRLRARCESELAERIATLTWQYVRRQRTWNAKERLDWAVDSTRLFSEQFLFIDSFVDFINK